MMNTRRPADGTSNKEPHTRNSTPALLLTTHMDNEPTIIGVEDLAMAVEPTKKHLELPVPIDHVKCYPRHIDKLRNDPEYAGLESIAVVHLGNYGARDRRDYWPAINTRLATLLARDDSEIGTISLNMTKMTYNGWDPDKIYRTENTHIWDIRNFLVVLADRAWDLHTVELEGIILWGGGDAEYEQVANLLFDAGKRIILKNVMPFNDKVPMQVITEALTLKTAVELKDCPWADLVILGKSNFVKELRLSGYSGAAIVQLTSAMTTNYSMEKLEIKDITAGYDAAALKVAMETLVDETGGNNQVIHHIECEHVALSEMAQLWLKINRAGRRYLLQAPGNHGAWFDALMKNKDDRDVCFWLLRNNTAFFTE